MKITEDEHRHDLHLLESAIHNFNAAKAPSSPVPVFNAFARLAQKGEDIYAYAAEDEDNSEESLTFLLAPVPDDMGDFIALTTHPEDADNLIAVLDTKELVQSTENDTTGYMINPEDDEAFPIEVAEVKDKILGDEPLYSTLTYIYESMDELAVEMDLAPLVQVERDQSLFENWINDQLDQVYEAGLHTAALPFPEMPWPDEDQRVGLMTMIQAIFTWFDAHADYPIDLYLSCNEDQYELNEELTAFLNEQDGDDADN